MFTVSYFFVCIKTSIHFLLRIIILFADLIHNLKPAINGKVTLLTFHIFFSFRSHPGLD